MVRAVSLRARARHAIDTRPLDPDTRRTNLFVSGVIVVWYEEWYCLINDVPGTVVAALTLCLHFDSENACVMTSKLDHSVYDVYENNPSMFLSRPYTGLGQNF